MAAAAVEKVVATVTGESRSARKKKAKAEAAAAENGAVNCAATPQAAVTEESAAAEETSGEHPYTKELQKQIRNTNKKLLSMAKVDSIIAENPGVSLDDLVSQRKINNDQRAAAQKKPQLQAQLADLEERVEHYRQFDRDYQVKLTKQRDELTSQHEQAIAKLREELKREAADETQELLRQKLLTFSQFLRCAAAKRNAEEPVDDDESRAFEGALLLVYGGDQKAVDTALSLIEGTDDVVPNIDGEPLQFTFAQVKEAALKYSPFQSEETWVDQVADATSGQVPQAPTESAAATSDPTVVNAGLTELSTAPNGVAEDHPAAPTSDPTSGEAAGNFAGERWDSDAAGTSAGAQKGGIEESYEIVPRPSEEVDIPAKASIQDTAQSTSWAEESHEAATGNRAGEAWDIKAPGEQDNGVGDSAADVPIIATDADGFSEVPSRGRGGRGGYRGRGDGEFRGRGGRRGNFRGRGDGEFRGGRGGPRGGRGDGGEYRGRGRGRGGPRGGAPAPANGS